MSVTLVSPHTFAGTDLVDPQLFNSLTNAILQLQSLIGSGALSRQSVAVTNGSATATVVLPVPVSSGALDSIIVLYGAAAGAGVAYPRSAWSLAGDGVTLTITRPTGTFSTGDWLDAFYVPESQVGQAYPVFTSNRWTSGLNVGNGIQVLTLGSQAIAGTLLVLMNGAAIRSDMWSLASDGVTLTITVTAPIASDDWFEVHWAVATPGLTASLGQFRYPLTFTITDGTAVATCDTSAHPVAASQVGRVFAWWNGQKIPFASCVPNGPRTSVTVTLPGNYSAANDTLEGEYFADS